MADSRRLALIAAYVFAAVVGYVLGSRGLVPVAALWGASTPLARVGFALQAPTPAGSPEDWADLREDIGAVRSTWKPDDRDAFDLVVAVRGLEKGGNADWLEAERLCRGLHWPRCDRAALEELQKRSRP